MAKFSITIIELLNLKKTLHQNERKMLEDKTRLTEQVLDITKKYNEEKTRMDHAERVFYLLILL